MRATAVICICLGFIRASVTLWLPAMLVSALGYDIKDSFWMILGISAVNFTGAVLSRKLLLKSDKRIGPVMVYMFSAVTLCSLLSAAFNNFIPLASVVMIAVISSMTIGLTTILLLYLPLTYAEADIVSSVVGILDFCVYAGAAVSSFVIGMLFTDLNLANISVLWMAVGAAAVVLGVPINRRKTALRSKGE